MSECHTRLTVLATRPSDRLLQTLNNLFFQLWAAVPFCALWARVAVPKFLCDFCCFSLFLLKAIQPDAPLRLLVLLAGFIAFSGCGPRQTEEQRRQAASTPAGKLGQAAHRATVEANKASQVIRRELGQAAHDAHEGWKEDARKQREKK